MVSKRTLQQVHFKDIDQFLDFLPDDELELVVYLRQLVFDCIPACEEKLSYNVPYFRRHKNICFIWPASVIWGKLKTYKGVRFGFINGNLLRDDIHYLEKGERKQVYWKDFIRPGDIDTDLLKSYIFEAVKIDQEKSNKRK